VGGCSVDFLVCMKEGFCIAGVLWCIPPSSIVNTAEQQIQRQSSVPSKLVLSVHSVPWNILRRVDHNLHLS
jgi:hypothetical protein